jgi:nucleoside-diphosphate-sugar epimerase
MALRETFPAPPIILITGATGWLGRRVIHALTEGIAEYPPIFSATPRLRCLVQASEPTDSLRAVGAEVVVGDIRDVDACRTFVEDAEDAIILHIAGVIHPPGRTWWFDAVNHRGTIKLYDAASAVGVRRFVAMSSNSPFGSNATQHDVFTEESPYNPYMGYGRSKFAMETALQRAMGVSALPEIVIIRGPWFYGPGQPSRQSQFFSLVRKGRFPMVGSGENRRSMVYTDNLAQGLLLAATVTGAAGNAFWIADEHPYSMNEIVSTVRTVLREDFGMEVSPQTSRLPSAVADAARIIDRLLQELGFYHRTIHVLSEMNLTIACNIEKAREKLGYKPSVALREGMRRSVDWCLKNGISI